MLSINTQRQNKPLVSFQANLYNNKKYPGMTMALLENGWSLLVKKPNRVPSGHNPQVDYSLGYSLRKTVAENLKALVAIKGYENVAFNPVETKKISKMAKDIKTARTTLGKAGNNDDRFSISRTIERLEEKLATYLGGKIKTAQPFRNDFLSTAEGFIKRDIQTLKETCADMVSGLTK